MNTLNILSIFIQFASDLKMSNFDFCNNILQLEMQLRW